MRVAGNSPVFYWSQCDRKFIKSKVPKGKYFNKYQSTEEAQKSREDYRITSNLKHLFGVSFIMSLKDMSKQNAINCAQCCKPQCKEEVK